MPSMEETFEAACAAKEIPGAVLLASDRSGDFTYAKSFGTRSLKDPNTNDPLAIDAVMWIASCTKLMTAISVMQCIERGQLKFDDDATTILHELKDIKVLEGFEEGSGTPILKKATNKITLRLMLTHSSGMGYDLFEPMLMKWRASQGEQVGQGNTIQARHGCPLLFEPGSSWRYSPGLDWAGLMVERVNDNMTLQAYMQKNIWEPLGINDITFWLRDREDMRQRMPDVSMRDPNGGAAAIYSEGLPIFKRDPTQCLGGAGVRASPPEYLKILHAVLVNDGTLMRPESMDQLFQPGLGDASKQAMMKMLSDPEENSQLGDLPLGMDRDYAFGGMVLLEDLPRWKRKGTLVWGGLPNLAWWIDREGDLCGLYASQLLPPGDPKSNELSDVFQKAMYQKKGHSTAKI